MPRKMTPSPVGVCSGCCGGSGQPCGCGGGGQASCGDGGDSGGGDSGGRCWPHPLRCSRVAPLRTCSASLRAWSVASLIRSRHFIGGAPFWHGAVSLLYEQVPPGLVGIIRGQARV